MFIIDNSRVFKILTDFYANAGMFCSWQPWMRSKNSSRRKFRPISSKLRSIEEKFCDLKSSVDYFSGKYDELLKKI